MESEAANLAFSQFLSVELAPHERQIFGLETFLIKLQGDWSNTLSTTPAAWGDGGDGSAR